MNVGRSVTKMNLESPKEEGCEGGFGKWKVTCICRKDGQMFTYLNRVRNPGQ